MKAIILAAGFGNRMRPFTTTIHKTMLMVAGETIVGRIIDGLLENGIHDIVVVTGYRADELKDYLRGRYPAIEFTFVHNANYRETNNIFSMALAFEAITIDSDIILIESDLIYKPHVIRMLLESKYANVALVDRYKIGMDGTVVTVENHCVTNVIPPHLQSDKFDFSDKFKTLNIYKFSRTFCETSFKKLLVYYANVIDKNCYYELILGILIYMQKETIHAEIVDGQEWAEVDDPNDLHCAEYVFNDRRKEILEYSFGGYWNFDVTDFCFIRNMYFPDNAILLELKNSLPRLLHNYGSRQEILDRKMSWFLLCKEPNVVALNGLSQVYPLLGKMFASKKILLPAPTFGEYARIFPNAATYRDEVGIATQEMETCAGSADVIVVVNPNNPTGTVLDSDWIYAFAERHGNKTVIVDESFIEFSNVVSVIELLEAKPLPNLLVLKSLSKSLGVPGLRLGYLYSCNAGMVSGFRADMPIWNMNSMAEFFLEIILKHRSTLKHSITATIADREIFSRDLATVPIIKKVHRSGANFLLIELSDASPDPDAISNFMLSEKAVYIKDVSSKFSKGKFFRLAVRMPEENSALVGHFREFCKNR